ncbi:1,4-dihydroxy-2-naphthoate polyprenyltransferase [Alicyclobacillus fastidiosus]|uniref:1,4-dihydroxy-2-naphthoate octaprenyltransferase n=1 Tax=Alicyclobacillus fastidiosus TaxID=392011 RepID=A0ABY6ZM69_9BACL|nr:1,4-dihydroxy-2-naphthoate polyprenyltransferase [Alicyclobacillus fastidiosus]WAH43984.1 1,4-dihydroxy-2-naphthoate polyprenyltransferase [Alicyclobacillus fastidiosus]GMA60254.1 1,4-dihydroxy-2-naphthoate octaprenyltransferase [Alicyclobacillus fastidiosus]
MQLQENVSQDRQLGRVLWKLTRPHTLTASFVPVLIGTVLAMSFVHLHILRFVAMLLSCLFIQIATNMFNEYYDHKRGLDTEHSIGIGGAIVRDGLHPKTVLRLALLCYLVALLIGVYLCMSSSWWLALIGSVGMLIGYLYTGGPLPIAYTPLGELFAGLSMGAMFILISFFIQTGDINTVSVLISVPIAILVGAINMSNNIRDLDGDKDSGRKTLAILVGHKRAVTLLAVMFVVAYLWITGLVVFGYASPWVLVVFLSIPKPIQAVTGFVGKRMPMQMMPAMKATAQTNTIFGLLLSVGLFMSFRL